MEQEKKKGRKRRLFEEKIRSRKLKMEQEGKKEINNVIDSTFAKQKAVITRKWQYVSEELSKLETSN
jgi:hypothetical protein